MVKKFDTLLVLHQECEHVHFASLDCCDTIQLHNDNQI